MKPIVKAILEVAREVGEKAVPGGELISHGVEAIIRKDDGVPAEAGALDVAEGAIKAIEGFKGADIADEVKFRAGVATMEAGFALVKASLKPSVPPAA